MTKPLTSNEQVERVRQAVLRTNGEVTVGDIVSATGLGANEAKDALSHLMSTHEGAMRVSSKGEIVYAFAPGCVLRDQRTWWERNKKAVLKAIKVFFKIIIMLTIVIYFIIYLVILIAILTSNRNNNSSGSFSFHGAIWIFWGGGGSSTEERWTGKKKEPLYTRIYNFVFGPEEEEIDPLEARTRCAQLIRAKKGVITIEDWMMVSGQSHQKCESDLARFTAEFDGNVEISDMGTLVYTFEDMMKSKDTFIPNTLPAMAWDTFEPPRALSGNVNGGDGIVIGLNLFNLVMAFGINWAGSTYIEQLQDPYYALQHGLSPQAAEIMIENVDTWKFWLGLFPLIFTALIFSGPLVRLPGHLKENRERRERTIRKAVMYSIFNKNAGAATRFSMRDLASSTNMLLNRQFLQPASDDEIKQAMTVLCNELGGEIDFSGTTNGDTYYLFKDLDARMRDTASERNKLAFDKQTIGEVVYSTDFEEQEEIEDAENQAELDAFDQALRAAGSKKRRPEYGNDDDFSDSQSKHNNVQFF